MMVPARKNTAALGIVVVASLLASGTGVAARTEVAAAERELTATDYAGLLRNRPGPASPPLVSPPVLDFAPLIRQNWLRIFGHYPHSATVVPQSVTLAPADATIRRPDGIMYRKDI